MNFKIGDDGKSFECDCSDEFKMQLASQGYVTLKELVGILNHVALHTKHASFGRLI